MTISLARSLTCVCGNKCARVPLFSVLVLGRGRKDSYISSLVLLLGFAPQWRGRGKEGGEGRRRGDVDSLPFSPRLLFSHFQHSFFSFPTHTHTQPPFSLPPSSRLSFFPSSGPLRRPLRATHAVVYSRRNGGGRAFFFVRLFSDRRNH